MNINFHEIEKSHLYSYHYYSTIVNNNDLWELNSFKIRNILSLAFNTNIKDLILENLFNDNGSFLTSETKDSLFRHLSIDERNELKDYLSNYLDFQINSGWYNNIIQVLGTEFINIIILPTLILDHNEILAQLKLLFPKKKFLDWFNYDETKKTLILDYNQAWKKRNIFTLQKSNSSAYFIEHFFENTFKWKSYNEDKHLFNRLNTQTRQLLFGKELLTELKEKLASYRPKNTLNEWDVLHESEHKYSFNSQEEIVIYYNSTNSNKYRISASFLLEKEGKYTIKNANDLLRNPEIFETKFNFSNIENIISQIDKNELNKAIDKDESLDIFIEPLWNKFCLKKEDGALWKQLLSQRSKENGLEKVFAEIEEISGIKKFVSLNTFNNTYCNPNNNTIIPRQKKVFKSICHYLGLDDNYRIKIHRERNLVGGHSQELHSKLKELVKVIVDYGILDKHNKDDELLRILNLYVDKIENRVDMEYFGLTRESLLYVCVAICYEIIEKMRLKSILKIEQIITN